MPAPVNFPSVDPFFPDTKDGIDLHLKQIAAAVRGILDGQINAAFDLELETGSAVQTVVVDDRIADTTRVILVPMDSVAATHLYAGTVRITEVDPGSFTLDHLPSTLTRAYRASLLS